MQAAGLVSTFGPIVAGRAKVTFLDQPDRGECEPRALHGKIHEFFQDRLHRSFLGNLQEQLRCQKWIEPFVAGGFHIKSILYFGSVSKRRNAIEEQRWVRIGALASSS